MLVWCACAKTHLVKFCLLRTINIALFIRPGEGAIEAKNVALPLLAGQDSFMKHGIIQLFKDPHPQRGCNWNKARK